MRDTHVNDDQQWYDTADIQQVHDLLTRAGAESIWVKRLVPNNNSKQQIFLGNDPSDLAFLPPRHAVVHGSEITEEESRAAADSHSGSVAMGHA